MNLLLPGIDEGKAARSIGAFNVSRFQTGLTDKSTLLVTNHGSNRNVCTEPATVGHTEMMSICLQCLAAWPWVRQIIRRAQSPIDGELRFISCVREALVASVA